MPKVDFGEWLPDAPENETAGSAHVKNCIPNRDSYRHFPSLAPFSGSLSDTATGMFWIRVAGVPYVFSGDTGKLYLLNGTSWGDVSKPATTYTSLAWDFVSFQNRVIATDGSSNIQYFDCGTSTTFDDLPGSPPKASCVGTVRDFVVVGDYSIGSETEPGGIAWCGFNNSSLWEPSLSTQAGRRRTRGTGGKVQRIVSGTQGVVFREDSILTLTYVGPPTVFRVDDLTTQHGTPAPRSVCWTKESVFYYSTEGFMQLDRRTLEIIPIGVFKVDKWFRSNVSFSDVLSLQGTVDRVNGCVYWAFKSTSSATSFDRLLVYNWNAKRWSYAELNCECIGEYVSQGYNLDTIGAFLGGNIDSASISMDTDAYAGGDVSISAFDSTHTLCSFSGTPLVAEIDTSEFSAEEGVRGFVNNVRPIIESSTLPSISVAPLSRNLAHEGYVVGSYANVNAYGLANLMKNARYHRFRVKIDGQFSHAKRVELMLNTRGKY